MESKPHDAPAGVARAAALGCALLLAGCGAAVSGAQAEDAAADVQGDASALADPGGAALDGGGLDAAVDLGAPDRGGDVGPAPRPGDDLFGAGLLVVDIDLPPLALAMLEVDPERYVEGVVTVDGVLLEGVGVRLKGRWGSFRPLEGKAAFILKFNEFNPGARLDGLKKLTLNNMVQDPSMLHEQAAYAFFRALGVPASRTTYARVRVNGAAYGLYAALEVPGTGPFLARWFDDAEGTLYEGDYGTDLRFDQLKAFDQDAGDDASRVDLYELALALDEAEATEDPGLRLARLEAVVDLERYLTFAAAEIVLAHWDGYVPSRNNYFVYHEPGGRWTFLPWGLDQTFVTTRNPWQSQARVQRLCLDTPPCRLRYGARLGEVAAAVEALGLRARVLEARALVLDQAPEDPRKEVEDARVAEAIQETLDFLDSWPGWVAANLACADPAQVDEDGDGVSGCLDDCDDTEADVHPGAPELCNLRDDDCDGVWDNAEGCPSCLAAQDQAGQPLALCFTARSWPAAREDCLAQGGDLASIHGPVAHEVMAQLAFDVMAQSWWIGLSDREQEGLFAWSDGTEVDFTWWADGEPNDAGGGEDCGHFAIWGGGRWNDLPCDRELPYVCKLAPAAP